MVLGLPASHPLARLAGNKSWESLPHLDLKLLKNEDFILLNKETRMRDMIDMSFQHAGFRPKILFESVSTRTVISMVANQIGPAFFPQSYVKPQRFFYRIFHRRTLSGMDERCCIQKRLLSYQAGKILHRTYG